jgi:lipoate-protein ligase A
MLISCNFDDVSKYLNPNKKKLISKGVDSVVQRVLNLKDLVPSLTTDHWEHELVKQFKNKYDAPEL